VPEVEYTDFIQGIWNIPNYERMRKYIVVGHEMITYMSGGLTDELVISYVLKIYLTFYMKAGERSGTLPYTRK
jgi:hypothetical protein